MPRFSRARWIMVGACIAALSLAGAAMVTAHNGPDKVQVLAHQINDRKPKNVIMFLGDGMGDSEITAARYYYAGAGGPSAAWTRFPFTGEQTTWSVKPGPGPTYLPDYVPDSAATGTAWSTGKKTIDERISQGPSTRSTCPATTRLQTVLELAQKRGMATGNVSTAEITDATPAVLASHISQRGCQGPDDTRTTCPHGDQGGRRPGLDRRAGGRPPRRRHPRRRQGPLRPDARRRPTQTVTQYAQAQGLPLRRRRGRPGRRSTTSRSRSSASSPRQHVAGVERPRRPRQQADGGYGPPVTCQTDQRPATEPSLADMTTRRSRC